MDTLIPCKSNSKSAMVTSKLISCIGHSIRLARSQCCEEARHHLQQAMYYLLHNSNSLNATDRSDHDPTPNPKRRRTISLYRALSSQGEELSEPTTLPEVSVSATQTEQEMITRPECEKLVKEMVDRTVQQFTVVLQAQKATIASLQARVSEAATATRDLEAEGGPNVGSMSQAGSALGQQPLVEVCHAPTLVSDLQLLREEHHTRRVARKQARRAERQREQSGMGSDEDPD